MNNNPTFGTLLWKRCVFANVFTCALDRYTRLIRRGAYGARACKDSRSVSTGDYSKGTGILVVGHTRKSDVPADPSVSRTRSCSSDIGKPDRSRLSSRIWKLKVQALVRGRVIASIEREKLRFPSFNKRRQKGDYARKGVQIAENPR